MKPDSFTLSLDQARQLAVQSQHLTGPHPGAGLDGMRQVLRGLRVQQMDPVNVVARNQFLVLWSRLGGFDRRAWTRCCARVDRKSGVLAVEGMYAEPGAPPDPALSAAIESLASFAGASSVGYAGPVAFGVS